MKKRLLGILLALVALVALCAVSVSAEDVDFTAGGTVNGWCQHCKANKDWLPLTQEVATGWGSNYSTSNGTHYYVAEESVTVTNGFTIGNGEELCLHLNGNTVTRAANGARAIYLTGGKMRIMDHAANEGVIQAYGSTSSTGCVIRMASYNATQVDMYGGTVRMLIGTSTTSKYAGTGGCVYVEKGTFNLHGGTITDGYAMAGGNVFMCKGTTFNMTGGTITNGSIKNATTSTSSIIDDHFGGNLYIAEGATAKLSGGSITNGTATSSGGNISNAGTLTVDGCTITGGVGTYGANIRCNNTSTLNLLSGTVSGGEGSKSGANIYTDGVIKLGACAVENGHSDTQGHNIRMDDEAKLTVLSTFTGMTTINVNSVHLPETFEGGYLTDTLDACEGVFTGKIYLEGTEQLVRLEGKADDTKLYTVVEEENFSGTGDMVAKCQHCGTQMVWRPLTAEVWSGWNKNYSQSNGTHYYLVEESTDFSSSLEIGSSEKLCLHLNGKTFAGRSTRPFRVYGTMSVMDHAANEGLLYGMAGSGTTGCVIRVEGVFNLYGGTVQMRTGSYNRGGNGGTIYVLADKTFNMYGGTVTGGIGENGGNIYVGSGATASLLGGTITGGNALKIDDSDGYGGNIYCAGTLVLGNCNVTNGTAAIRGNDIYLSATGQLTVKSDFAGETKLGLNTAHLSEPILGGYLSDALDSCEGPFAGKLYLENSSYLPPLYGKADDTKIYIPDTALVAKDNTTVWYGSTAEAMEAYGENTAYMVTGAAALEVDGGTYTVDLAGSDLAVSGTGTITLFDSANKDGVTYGTATVTDVTVANETKTEVGGTDYYMVQEGSTYSFHCISVGLSGCNIRPSSSGIYYPGTWSCDDKMATMLDTFGVAVSLTKVPDEKFETDTTCLYTAFDGTQMESGVTRNGAIIQGILEESNTAYRNNKNARMPIYACAYMKLKDGTVIVDDQAVGYSLYTAMTQLNELIGQNPAAYAEARASARAFYQTWVGDGMGTWSEDLGNILARVEDGKLNLLMVGNSFCYYYVEELYNLLMADLPEGITEVNIYNLYYSGCRLNQHLDWWKNNTAKYEFYKTDASGRNLLGEKGEWTLEEALKQEDWDYISLQGMPSDNTSYPKAEETGMHLRVAELAEPLLDRFHALYPHAQLLWHRTWYFEIGRVSNGFTYTEEYGVGYNEGMQFVCDYMCNEWDKTKPYDLIQVNSGDIWTKVRATEGVDELLPFGGLCARLGQTAYGENLAGYEGETADSGDGYHDGDIGGGQLINAYAWYETLTGNDSRDSDYVPTYTRSGVSYTLSEELCELIRECTHEVISQMPETVQPAV